MVFGMIRAKSAWKETQSMDVDYVHYVIVKDAILSLGLRVIIDAHTVVNSGSESRHVDVTREQ